MELRFFKRSSTVDLKEKYIKNGENEVFHREECWVTQKIEKNVRGEPLLLQIEGSLVRCLGNIQRCH